MDITLKVVALRGGALVQTKLNLTQRSDGSWHAKNFDDILKQADSASKSGAPQSRDRDTYETVRTTLSDQEIAELAGKYNPHNMTQDQYDTFLDDLIEKGALSRFDAMRLRHHGWRILDIDPGTFAAGGIGNGPTYVIGTKNNESQLIQSLEDADGNLIRWLENMLVQQNQESRAYNRQKKESLDILSDIVKRMQMI